MRNYLRVAKRLVLVATPAIASSILTPLPSQAATFATSEGQAFFFNFSQNPSSVTTDTDTYTTTAAKDSFAYAEATADAHFLITPAVATNPTLSLALGEGRDYLGLAESQASVIGYFNVKAGTDFSFKFSTELNLSTSIENPPAENVSAVGDISFALLDLDHDKVLDFFSLVGNLNTLGDDDFVAIEHSDSVTFIEPESESSFGGNNEFARSNVLGNLQRSFTNTTNLALVEIKRNQTRVQAPEPSSVLALLAPGAVIGTFLKRRGKKQTSEV
ncbi:MAG: hypothetical protein SAK29_08240 [Scytonema sp. PMC 1069.18]|nr:hypothetical protein [Scytonema sp. PMC 1069.18]MEC4880858.1 hypothetical protein [Scytonema sp. PMC 1070.18]